MWHRLQYLIAMTLSAMRFFAVRHRRDGGPAGAHIENIEPSFMARPMSPLTFSLPDMKSI